ncbi:MAG: hypothetical protein KC478_02550 [Bacteriovoracaceae bacterium]|nr:hypothetical protein [Bacteriovoracaceae bacterium]
MKKLRANLFLILLLLSGCDFTSGLHKDILKAQEHITKQEFSKAVEVYEEILKRKPSKTIQIKINYQLGEIYSLYLNDYEKALYHLETIISSSNEPLWQKNAMERIGAIQFEKFRNYKQAKIAYKSLMNFVPKLERQEFYSFRFALCEFHLKNYKKSDKLFKELSLIVKEGIGAESFYYLGLTKFYLKEWDAAISFWFEFLKREKRKDKIVQAKFLIANAYESAEKLKEAYNIYYSIIGEYPNPDVIENRLNSLYERRVARKR